MYTSGARFFSVTITLGNVSRYAEYCHDAPWFHIVTLHRCYSQHSIVTAFHVKNFDSSFGRMPVKLDLDMMEINMTGCMWM